MSSYYSDDDDFDIHVQRRSSPLPYAEERQRPRSYYAQGPAPSYLIPERTIIRTQSRSRERSRERRSSPPSTAPPPPVIINNRIYNEHSSDEEDDRRLQLVRPSRRSHSRSRSSSSFRMTREEYEMERARQELENLKMMRINEEKERQVAKEQREEAELKRAKQELEEIKRREAREQEEKRIKRELELKRLQEEEREEEERKRREKEAQQAVEKYKKQEMERLQKEREEREQQEKEYRRRLQEDLINSGLDEKQIAAILKKEKVPEAVEDKQEGPRPTYTRMARRHLSIETLRTFRLDYEIDPDPEYVLIKRWVPEWEQDTLWKHTKYLREKRTKLLLSVEDKKSHHRHREPEFEWVRKKERKRSKSPALLMYLAGAKPA